MGPGVSLKARLAAREPTLATFIKTPHPAVVEVLAMSPLDALILDAEHAPFDRTSLDLCVLAARAGGKDVLIRPESASPEHILQALDLGATGVLAPHVKSAEAARDLVSACRYGPGGRGYAGSSRPARYGRRPMAEHIAGSNADTVIVAQIEDLEALDAIEAILAVDGIDAFFIGRADLTVALGCTNADDPKVVAAVERICAAGRAANRCIGMFFARPGDAPHWRAHGASFFALASDHAFLLAGADRLAAEVLAPGA